MESALKIYLPVYLILFLLVAFVLPTVRTWKQTGINPITFGDDDNAHDYIGLLMKSLIALLLGSILFYSFSGSNYKYLLPVWYLETRILRIVGLIVMHASLIFVIIAQQQMSNSWRIGIDEKHRTALVTHGVFSICRNPIFFGLILTVWSLFLVLPNAVTFSLSLATWVIIQIQIRLEEEFLQKQHGQAYKEYKSKTRRLI